MGVGYLCVSNLKLGQGNTSKFYLSSVVTIVETIARISWLLIVTGSGGVLSENRQNMADYILCHKADGGPENKVFHTDVRTGDGSGCKPEWHADGSCCDHQPDVKILIIGRLKMLSTKGMKTATCAVASEAISQAW